MPTIYAFGPFRLDAEAEILLRGGEALPVGRRAAALLRVMVERAGEAVTKDGLIEAAWSGVAVDESNLSVQVRTLRRTFAEEPGGESWIETLHGRGYRFVGPAVTRSDAPVPAGGLALPDKPSIVVLPFTNMSADPEQEYFVDGITEDLITALAKWHYFFVIARNSAFVYKGRAVDVKEVGRHLGVRYVLEGSARRAGARIRVNAQLIDAASGLHIWAERFDRDLTDVFVVQDELTQCVAAAIGPALIKAETEQARRKTPEQLAVWDLYLRGRWHYYQHTEDGFAKATAYARRALALDESAAELHAGIAAVSYTRLMLCCGPSERATAMADVIQSARRALSLDRDNVIAHVILSSALSQSGDPEAGYRLARRATELNGNFAVCHVALAVASRVLGRLEEALTAIDLALRLSPSDPETFMWRAVRATILYLLGRYTEAIAAARQSLATGWFHLASRVLAASYAQLGLIEDAGHAICELLASEQGEKSIADVVRPYVRAEDRERWAQGLRAAGLPEV